MSEERVECVSGERLECESWEWGESGVGSEWSV